MGMLALAPGNSRKFTLGEQLMAPVNISMPKSFSINKGDNLSKNDNFHAIF
jgi:hypothetical protein